MTRIAKNDVHAAMARVAQHLTDARAVRMEKSRGRRCGPNWRLQMGEQMVEGKAFLVGTAPDGSIVGLVADRI
ncbi:hypothetical protein L6R29_05755 [Myxococcota bacterium]|nr:hypothetical protein [Myxococcota bacterium]